MHQTLYRSVLLTRPCIYGLLRFLKGGESLPNFSLISPIKFTSLLLVLMYFLFNANRPASGLQIFIVLFSVDHLSTVFYAPVGADLLVDLLVLEVLFIQFLLFLTTRTRIFTSFSLCKMRSYWRVFLSSWVLRSTRDFPHLSVASWSSTRAFSWFALAIAKRLKELFFWGFTFRLPGF